MKNVLRYAIPLLLVGSSLVLGQRALELEQQIPGWQGGEMNLYFDMAVFPDVQPDGSFSFAESTPEFAEGIELMIQIGEGFSFEDLYPWCFDEEDDALELSTEEAGYWGFRTARLNQRTDGTNDGTAELKAQNGSTLSFVYADRPVEVTGYCYFGEGNRAEFDLELAPEVRYVMGEPLGEEGFRYTTDVSQEDVGEWVFELK